MNAELLLEVFLAFAPLSLVAVGGASAILPEMNRQVVVVHPWVSDAEFASLYALSQMAPGPNAMVVSLIGWRVAGWMGAIVAAIAIVAPSSILAYAVCRLGRRPSVKPWLMLIQAGLAPIAVGLIMASGFIVALGVNPTWSALAVTAISVVLFLRTGIHPLLPMAAVALVSVAGLI
jgi:chromate transporter